MDENNQVPALPPTTEEPTAAPVPAAAPEEEKPKPSPAVIALIVAVSVVILLLIVGAIYLLNTSIATTAKVRDIFIIFLALESIVLGVAMVILIIQLATLINLLQNDIKPIIKSTNETVNTLRGTATFISDNVSEPIITLNSYLAGFSQFFNSVRPRKTKR